MKKLIALLACLTLSLHLVGCTSSKSKDESDTATAEASADGATLDGDLETVQGSDASGQAATTGEAATADNANEGFLDEQLPEDALGENKDAQATPPATETPAATTDSSVATDSTTPDGFSAPPPIEDTNNGSVAGVDTGTETPAAPSDTASSSAGDESKTSSSASESAPAPVATASLKKIDTVPRTVAGKLLNGVYISRPKDTWKSISTMVYGSADKAKEIKAENSWISGQPKAGDKVYYNSPQRPTDDTRVLTYYEDAGVVPEVYVTKDGDNLKKVAKNLLGYDGAWKEVWATNSVDSKAELSAGTELRYWKTAPATVPPPSKVAEQTPPPAEAAPAPEPQAELPPPPPANEMPPPPDQAMAGNPNETAPAPPAEMAPPPPAAADLPPPPPPAEAVNPPPPPPIAKQATNIGEETPADQDTMMMLGGGAIVAAGLALMLVIRKRRQQRDMASAFNDTQVGS